VKLAAGALVFQLVAWLRVSERLPVAPVMHEEGDMRMQETERRTDITPAEAYRARGRARLVDVREAHELASDGFIPGIEHVPLANVGANARTWDRDQEVILVCRSGARSGRAADLLVSMGFRHVRNLTGGMLAYRAAGLPVDRS
jgi:rhodanese-related sulfurtransferase